MLGGPGKCSGIKDAGERGCYRPIRPVSEPMETGLLALFFTAYM